MFRTERRTNPAMGARYPFIGAATAVVNQFYFYGADDDFGPCFIKFCSYFPYTAKVCVDLHHWAQRQAALAGAEDHQASGLGRQLGARRRQDSSESGSSNGRTRRAARQAAARSAGPAGRPPGRRRSAEQRRGPRSGRGRTLPLSLSCRPASDPVRGRWALRPPGRGPPPPPSRPAGRRTGSRGIGSERARSATATATPHEPRSHRARISRLPGAPSR